MTFKIYGTSFKGFIPFVKGNFGSGSSNASLEQEHMYFLLYWLNKFVFPNKSKGMKVEWIPLVEALHNFDDVATGPFLLAHFYRLLFEMTQDTPFETNLNGPTWMIQLWLQWYFPEFWAANLEFPEGVAPAESWPKLLQQIILPSPAFTSSEFVELGQIWSGEHLPLEDTLGSLIKLFKMPSEKTLPLFTERNLLVAFSLEI